VKQFGIRQRTCIRGAYMIEDSLLTLRLIHRQLARLFEFANRTRSLSTPINKANDLYIQLINLLSPVGDIHAVASPCSRASPANARCELFLYAP
jgi:hypothetical protein